MEDPYDESNEHNNLMTDNEYVDEYDLLMEALNNVEMSLIRYMERLYHIWNDRIIPFIESADCSIMERLNRSDSRNFYTMMYNQPIYIEMVCSHKKIQNKLEQYKQQY